VRAIGLTGKMASGKDHLFNQLVRRIPSAVRYSFADLVRYEIQDTLAPTGMELPALWDKPYPEEVRRLMQFWGTDLRRKENPEYWIEKMQRHVSWWEGELPVFTDVRFPNEADMIRFNEGIIVRVVAPHAERADRLGMLPPDHASETAMDDYQVDYVIESSEDNTFYAVGVDLILGAAGGASCWGGQPIDG